jgi:hypothetical protein
MGQPTRAAQGLWILLGYGPIADILPVVVGTQPIRLILATRSLVAPQPILTLLHSGYQVAVRQIGKRVAAVEAADVFKENEMLAMGAMKGFHVASYFKRIASRRVTARRGQWPTWRPSWGPPVARVAPDAADPRGGGLVDRLALPRGAHSHSPRSTDNHPSRRYHPSRSARSATPQTLLRNC